MLLLLFASPIYRFGFVRSRCMFVSINLSHILSATLRQSVYEIHTHTGNTRILNGHKKCTSNNECRENVVSTIYVRILKKRKNRLKISVSKRQSYVVPEACVSVDIC